MCVWPAEFPSIQPGLGNLPLPLSIPIPLPATVTFCAWSCPVPRHVPTHSKENKNEQLITRTDISNMWLSTCFFQVLGDFFPSSGRQELLRELPASTPPAFDSGFPTKTGPAASFPQAAGIFLFTLQCSLSLLSLCTPPGWTSGHIQNNTFQRDAPGQPRSVWVHIPRALANPSPLLQPTAAFGCLPHRDFPSP